MLKNPTAFVIHAPYSPSDFQILDDEDAAFALAQTLTDRGVHATALIGTHSGEELFAAIRRERAAHVARCAARLADQASRVYDCCLHCDCPGPDGHIVPCTKCQRVADNPDRAVARAMNGVA